MMITRLSHLKKKDRRSYFLSRIQRKAVTPGNLILFEPIMEGRGRTNIEINILRILSEKDTRDKLSSIAIRTHNIPDQFSKESLAIAKTASSTFPFDKENREDITHLPLVTIDGIDARDFDDAVWAEPDNSPENLNGWHLIVAIADVSHYVKPESPLDLDAFERGNSVYFPDQVVPMLPEELSNNLCSLRPNEDRACMMAHLWISAEGHLIKHTFKKGLMRSCARLTYEQVQAIHDGTEKVPNGLSLETIRQLYGAYKVLKRARLARNALDFERIEPKIVLDSEDRVIAVDTPPRLNSHMLIEEFMILANVAAAETLENRRQKTIYRVHDEPDPIKVSYLKEQLNLIGLKVGKSSITPAFFNDILHKAHNQPYQDMVNELTLRAQTQAVYTPNNNGHFGLALEKYCHFTSPIRRYADLVVHRALSGEAYDAGTLEDISLHINMTERRAIQAERETLDRFMASYLAQHILEIFEGKINGLNSAGLFVTLTSCHADAFLPTRFLRHDYFKYNEKHNYLIGTNTKEKYQMGDLIQTRLLEANPISGNILIELAPFSKRK